MLIAYKRGGRRKPRKDEGHSLKLAFFPEDWANPRPNDTREVGYA